MEKLLQLLNEYDKDSMRTEKSVYAHETGVISKKFGFIKWLRSHDRIRDFGPLEQLVNGYGRFQEYESRLMLLSIQDEPISFLISILK